MRLRKIEDIDSRMLFASQEINHGDWPFRFWVRVEHCEEYDREWAEQGKYHVSLLVVSPDAAKKQWESASNFIGVDPEEFAALDSIGRAMVLIDYGTFATLWQSQGNNLRKLMREARRELKQLDFLFGFAMDRPQNAIGASGWDFVAGNPLGSLLR